MIDDKYALAFIYDGCIVLYFLFSEKNLTKYDIQNPDIS